MVPAFSSIWSLNCYFSDLFHTCISPLQKAYHIRILFDGDFIAMDDTKGGVTACLSGKFSQFFSTPNT